MTASVLDKACVADADAIDSQKDAVEAEAFKLHVGVFWLSYEIIMFIVSSSFVFVFNSPSTFCSSVFLNETVGKTFSLNTVIVRI